MYVFRRLMFSKILIQKFSPIRALEVDQKLIQIEEGITKKKWSKVVMPLRCIKSNNNNRC